MKPGKRPRVRRLPEFLPLDQLTPGQPFNPNALLVGFQVRQAILAHPKLSSGAKNLWLLLADECYDSGYDSQTQGRLAQKLAVTTRQLRRYLDQLKRHHLVHVEPELGRQDYHWLIYQLVFASCSPRTQDKSVLGGRTYLSGGVGQVSPPQRNYQRNYQRMGGATRLNATSSSVPLAPDRGREGEDSPAWGSLPPGTDNGEFVYSVSPLPGLRENTPASDAAPGDALVIAKDARSFWYSLSPIEKHNRLAQAAQVRGRIHYFRQYLKDPDAAIARQARHEITRALDDLGSLGFTLHTNGKGKL